ncbi:MAG: quinolinate synthase NadA, partial [Sedimentisphaerales bacterium]|nr:quinolinate synthase NadA [Sedimentisphaerales bacterium]
TMALIDPQHLAWLLDEIAAYAADPAGCMLSNQVTVDANVAKEARRALERMLAIK